MAPCSLAIIYEFRAPTSITPRQRRQTDASLNSGPATSSVRPALPGSHAGACVGSGRPHHDARLETQNARHWERPSRDGTWRPRTTELRRGSPSCCRAGSAAGIRWHTGPVCRCAAIGPCRLRTTQPAFCRAPLVGASGGDLRRRAHLRLGVGLRDAVQKVQNPGNRPRAEIRRNLLKPHLSLSRTICRHDGAPRTRACRTLQKLQEPRPCEARSGPGRRARFRDAAPASRLARRSGQVALVERLLLKRAVAAGFRPTRASRWYEGRARFLHFAGIRTAAANYGASRNGPCRAGAPGSWFGSRLVRGSRQPAVEIVEHCLDGGA
jgi:hypothetical protein